MCAPALCAHSRGTAATCGIDSSARAARCGRARVVAFGATGRAHASAAAGITWTSRTLKAQWAGRNSHTSVIDAFGAIYVIGGYGSTGYLKDVWVSTDRGARPDSVKGDGPVVLAGVLKGLLWGYYVGTMEGTLG